MVAGELDRAAVAAAEGAASIPAGGSARANAGAMRVAVVGAGISGLVAASLLHREHEVAVFEANERAGGHAQTVELTTAEGRVALDVGFLVFEPRGYPNFQRLVIDACSVPTQPAPISMCVSDQRDGFEWASRGLGLGAHPANLLRPRYRRMLREVVRFNSVARRLIEGGDEQLSFASFLAAEGMSRDFVERLIVPEVATVWSAGSAEVLASPARFVVQVLDNLRLLQLRRRARFRSVSGGSSRYVEAISKPFRQRIRFSAPVGAIERGPSGVQIRVQGREPEAYEAVVIAVHADQALALLADPSPGEREILGQIPFRRSLATLHGDTRLLPQSRRARASWNFRLGGPDASAATVTYWLNNVQRLKAVDDYLVTLNQAQAVDPAKTIRRLEYRHPVFSAEAVRAQARWAEISGANRTHYAGAYWGWGTHEDGVVSAIRATRPLLSRPEPLARARP